LSHHAAAARLTAPVLPHAPLHAARATQAPGTGGAIPPALALLVDLAERAPRRCRDMARAHALPFLFDLLTATDEEVHRNARQLIALIVAEQQRASAAAAH
jgi:hypothetical protein